MRHVLWEAPGSSSMFHQKAKIILNSVRQKYRMIRRVSQKSLTTKKLIMYSLQILCHFE